MEENIFYNAVALALESDLRKLGKAWAAHENWAAAWRALPQEARAKINPEKEWAKLEDAGVQLVLQSSSEYPSLLKETPQAPLGLYIKGTLPQDFTQTL